jgi:hypothetical protein
LWKFSENQLKVEAIIDEPFQVVDCEGSYRSCSNSIDCNDGELVKEKRVALNEVGKLLIHIHPIGKIE